MLPFGTSLLAGSILGAVAGVAIGIGKSGVRGAVRRGPRVVPPRVGPSISPAVFGALRGRVGGKKAYPGLLAGAAKFGLGMGAAGAMDRYLEYNSDTMSPAGQALLGIGSFAARFGAYRSLIRGGLGSAAAGIEAAGAGAMPGARKLINTGMGGVLTPGSLVNRTVLGTLKGVGGFAFKFPFRTAMGMAQSAVSVPMAFGRMFTGGSVSGALDVGVWGRRKLFNNKFGRWMFNKDLDAPLGHGVFAWAGLAGMATNYMNARASQQAPYRTSYIRDEQLDPNRYQQGVFPMPRRAARNEFYGPALTLQLAHNNQRVMP
jgi:hypothetical protein